MVVSWNHNSWYHPFVLRRIGRPPAGTVLDLGCGSGRLARRLAAGGWRGDAVDADPAIVAIARRRSPSAVTVTVADALEWLDGHPERYDAVVAVSSLHHLPLPAALRLSAAALRPGGRFVALTHVRSALPADLPFEMRAISLHHLIGAGLRLSELLTGREHRLRRHEREDREWGMATTSPIPYLAELRAVTGAALPGSVVRRLALWRVAVVWTKPAGP